MKRLLFFALSVVLAAPMVRAELKRETLTTHFESCEAIIREFQADPQLAIPDEVLQQAKGLVITNQVKAGLIIGLKTGYGVVMARHEDGSWSTPALLKASEGSFGLQIGGSTVETVYVLMDDATPRLLFQDRFNIGVDAKAIYGPRAYEAEKVNKDILTTPVLVYTKGKGLYAGATVKGGWVGKDDRANLFYYDTNLGLPELLYGNSIKTPSEVQPLVSFVEKITK